MDNPTKIAKFARLRNAYPLGGHKTHAIRKHGFEAAIGRFEAEGLSARNFNLRPARTTDAGKCNWL